jgi:hypothetical protein
VPVPRAGRDAAEIDLDVLRGDRGGEKENPKSDAHDPTNETRQNVSSYESGGVAVARIQVTA